MKSWMHKHHKLWPVISGLAAGLLVLALSTGLAGAAPAFQDAGTTATPGPAEEPTPEPKPCGDCHLDIANTWSDSPHARAFENPAFQEHWLGSGKRGECLLCHTSNYQRTTGVYAAEGVNCEACHGQVDAQHPPAVVPLHASTEYCGTCHTTTLSEWRLTGHASAGVGCSDCHDAHSQKALFEVVDDTCLNCHEEDMGEEVDDLHLQKGIGCVDCHAVVIPPEEPPLDGLVPTGHSFTVHAETCVACHTDTLHSGPFLPGYEYGATAALEAGGDETEAQAAAAQAEPPADSRPDEKVQVLEKQLQATQAALASRGMAVLFQGGVIGLVLGGSTAWLVARNARRSQEGEDHEEEA
jgi:hypothetical protein